MIDLIDTPEALREWRIALGLTQTAAAEMLGLPRRSYCRWENGEGAIERPLFLSHACNSVANEIQGKVCREVKPSPAR